MRKKINVLVDSLRIIFGYGIMIVLLTGGLTAVGFVVALLVGGDTAAAICSVISNQIFPVIIYATTCLILLGLATMYLAGEKALTPDSEDDDFEKSRDVK